MTRDIKAMVEIYFIAGTQDCKEKSLIHTLEEALQAGITCFQFREKGKDSLETAPAARVKMAQVCQLLCRQYDVPFIVNDDVELAVQLDADGIHVGQGDYPIQDLISKWGDRFIIGLSTNNVSQFKEAETISGLDYAGIGPAFTPLSKHDHEDVIGLKGIQEAMTGRNHLPAVAIGGINPSNVKDVWATGVDGVAVVSSITRAVSVIEAVQQLKK